MPQIGLKPLVRAARAGGWSVGSFSVSSLEMIRGVVAAAEALRSPVMLQIAECRLDAAPLHLIGPAMVAAARAATVPVCVHFDHGLTEERILEAIDLGFNSVMIDGSHLELDANIALTRRICALAHARGADCEGEVGRVGGSEDGSTEIEMHITRVEDAARFCRETGVDAVAVAIGNAHGNYAEEPKLQFGRLEAIRAAVEAPLVLHGGSGIPDEDFQRAIRCGIAKINIATAIGNRVTEGLADWFAGQPGGGCFAMQGRIASLAEACVSDHIRIFMSDGRAAEIRG